jgi:selenocysteine-specific elongation factor
MSVSQQGHYIIGTAGHVDHGKTALIKALTGAETDRLKEEQKRGISIELGFAKLDLGDGDVAGIVDVPGHEKFIPQMLSGIAGIDLVLLVVDANEGVMPQTREHLQIMNLLQLKNGIIVISKCDLVEPDWLDIVEEEIREQVAGTFLAQAPCCRVSALQGNGLEPLLETIRDQLRFVEPRDPHGAIRLPVDRCFSLSGFGTVVTGTLVSGTVATGDTLEVLPAGVQTRVREVQVHDKPVDIVSAGQRVALNLAGVNRDQIPRGSVIAQPGLFSACSRLDVRLQLLDDAPRALKFRDPLHFHLGTGRSVARLILLDREQLNPGEEVLAQLVLDRPLLAHRGDRFILRSYSPMVTIGGGLVIDHEPQKHKRFRPEIIEQLSELASGDLGFWLQKLDELQIARIKELEKQTGNSREQLQKGLERLCASGQLEQLGDQWVLCERVRSWTLAIPQLVAKYHQQFPLHHGIPRATLQSQISEKLAPKGFEVLLQRALNAGTVVQRRDLLALPKWEPQLGEQQRQALDALDLLFSTAGFGVKNNNEVVAQLGLDVEESEAYFNYLALEGKLVRLNQESSLSNESYGLALHELRQILSESKDGFALAAFRDRLGSSRRLIQALLEHFDSLKYTRRVGDKRVVWQLPASEKDK